MIIINLEDTIQPHYVGHDLADFRFYSPLKNGGMAELLVQIRNINDPLLPNVFNLGFGPPDNAGSFSDTVSINHSNPGKVFSTILLLAIAFLKRNPLLAIGIDGSDDRRAYLYHRMFSSNRHAMCGCLGVAMWSAINRAALISSPVLKLLIFKEKQRTCTATI